jgi:hypothetical protein
MKLSKRDCDNLIDALMEYDEQVCPKELADDEVGLNAERFEDIIKRLTEHAYKDDKRAEALPANVDKFIWVLDASSGIVFKVEIPANFPEDAQCEDYEDFLEANLPNDIRLKDCDWMIGIGGVVTIHRDRYHLGF